MGKHHVGGKGSCWWEKIMLVGKDHVGGKRSCWWEKIMLLGKDHMLVGKDHAVVEDSKLCRIMISAQKKHVFCTEWVPICPFATKIAANYMSARRRPDFMGVLGSEDKPMSRYSRKNTPKKMKGCPYILSLNRTTTITIALASSSC